MGAKDFQVEHKGNVILVTGRIYFANCDDLIEAVGVVKGFSEVVLDVSTARLLDYSATAAMDELVIQYKTADITLNVVRESDAPPSKANAEKNEGQITNGDNFSVATKATSKDDTPMAAMALATPMDDTRMAAVAL